MNAVKYNLKRNKRNYRIIALLPYILLFVILLLASSIQNSFKKEYLRVLVDKYPTDSFDIQKDALDCFKYKNKINVYEYYVGLENDVTALYIAEKKDSVLNIEGMLQVGCFPEKENEVIVTEGYIISKMKGDEDSLNQYLGTKIMFSGKEFVISGITYSLDESSENYLESERFFTYFYTDVYYTYATDSTIFIPYKTIKTMYEPQNCYIGDNELRTEMVRGYYRDLFDDNEMLQVLRGCFNSEVINSYDKEIHSAENTVDSVIKIFLLVLIVCFIVACVFMNSQIRVELFYRRKELGYLQIFGVSKIKIYWIVYVGYILKLVIAMILAIPIYFIIIWGYHMYTGSYIIFNIQHIIMIVACIVIFYSVTIFLGIFKFMRRSIIKLINE